MTEPIPIDDLTFGVELECVMPWDNCGEAGRDALAAHLTRAGVPTHHESYNHVTRSHWKIVTDGSLGHDDAEVVSPVLQGEAGLTTLVTVCRLITEFGARTSRACGVHVHVGVRDPYGERVGFFKELLRTHAKFRPVLDQLVAPSRRASSYARPIPWTAALEAATSLRQLARACNASHFSNPNFWDAYSRHGTVEFRQHQGSLNGEKLTNWVKLCLRIVAHAGRNDERTIDDDGRPRHPSLPLEPRFVDPPELGTARPVPVAELTARNLRYYSRSWVIGQRRPIPNPRRPTTAGHGAWDLYVAGRTIREFVQLGGRPADLRYDVERGRVAVLNATTAVPTPPTAVERARREAVLLAWRINCAAIQAEYERTLATRPVVHRPPTDAAPATLDGLLDLIGADPAERAFFGERVLELNELNDA